MEWLIGISLVFLLILLYPLLLIPNISRKETMRSFQKHLFAHRGLYDNNDRFPENSMAAFERAVQNGYGIEMDLQLTKDKQVVVIHDYDLKRVAGKDIKIGEQTYEELKSHILFQSAQQIPLFQDVLAMVNGRVPLIIELKARRGYQELCLKTWELLKNYQGLYCIESFHPLVVFWFKKNHPFIIRGQLSSNFAREQLKDSKIIQFVLTNLLLNFVSKPDFIAYNYQYKKNFSLILCKSLYKVKTAAWTIKSQRQLEENIKDFDIIIFDSFLPDKGC